MTEMTKLSTLLRRTCAVLMLLIAIIILLGCSEQEVKQDEQFVNKITPYVGDWTSTINTGPEQTAPIILHIKQVEKKIEVTLDSPNQNAFDIPLTPIDSLAEQVILINEALKLKLIFELSKASLVGDLSVGEHHFSVDFFPSIQARELNVGKIKQQTPKPPFKYGIEELNVASDSHTLAATLTVPVGQGPFPAVVLISGSGPDNRNYTKFGHHRFWVTADHLVRSGIAVLRYDERGVGESTGDYGSVNFTTLVNDVNSLVSKLRNDKRFDANKIGVIGHSEGTMIATIAATSNEDIQYTALLGGMYDYELGLSLQYENIAQELGVNESEFVTAIKSLEQLAINNAAPDELSQYYINNYASNLPIPEQLLQFTADHFTSEVMRNFLSYQPEHYLPKLNIPVFTACGTLDQYFDCERHMQKAQSIIAKNQNSNLVSKVYPNLNHYFQTASTGKIAEEPSLPETISTTVLSDLSQWILQQK